MAPCRPLLNVVEICRDLVKKMSSPTSLIISSIVFLFCLSGCASTIVKPTEFSGYLTDYSKLKSTVTMHDTDTLLWVSPRFKEGSYRKVRVEMVVFHPEPKISDQISKTALANLREYSGHKIRNDAMRLGILSHKTGDGILSLKMAITGVKISNEALQPLEVIPFKLVLAGAGAAIGFRDRDIDIYFEIMGQDSVTHNPLFTMVHKINGGQLDSKWDQMELKHVQKAIDQFSEKGIEALANHLRTCTVSQEKTSYCDTSQ